MDFVTAIITHFKDKIRRWGVLNEFAYFNNQADDVLRRSIGHNLPAIIFRSARLADPSAELLYTDIANETMSKPCYPRTKAIVDRLKAQGLIDAVGLQMHIKADSPPSRNELIQAMHSYGLPIYVTEMDVDLRNVKGTQEKRSHRQAKVWSEIMHAALDSGVCRSFTMVGTATNSRG